ncbi:MAG: hypothetical protein U0R52_06630 [Solirubrobacterales bacterium]
MPDSARRTLVALAWMAGVSAVLLAVFPVGFPNYDTIYALLWGRELAHGISPDYAAALPPTPHPLADLLGILTTPLGDGAITVTMVIAYASLGLIAYLVYRLGSLWFDQAIGVLAALIVLTRAPYLSNGIRAYVDLPYIALCLAALAIESRRRRAGWPVLALLALAGLLRPEAWLFSAAYLAYLALDVERRAGAGQAPWRAALRWRGRGEGPGLGWRGERPGAELAWLAALAVSAPVAWGLFDLITAGSATYSFTGTRDTVETLERQTGPVDLVLYGPRRLGEVLQWPGMVGAAGGLVLTVALMPRRAAIGAAAAALALGAFALLACAGLAIIPRYTMLAAAVLAVFASAGLLGWRLLERGARWRGAWQGFAAVVALMFVVWGPNQYDLLKRVDTDLANQGQIEADLSDLADSGAFDPLCLPISVPNHRAVPRLAFDLDVKPSQVVSSSEERQPRRGYFLAPASPFVIHNFILDPNDTRRLRSRVPPGFGPVARNRSWRLYRRCR